MTLTEFLLARIADEESMIGTAEGTPSRTGWQLWTNLKSTTPGGETLGPRGSIEMSSERALAECEAKRRIVELHRFDDRLGADWTCAVKDGSAYADGWGDAPWPCETLRLLALPYAEHPDYREEWRP